MDPVSRVRACVIPPPPFLTTFETPPPHTGEENTSRPHGEVLPAGSLEPRRRLDENWDPELRWHGH